jgi:hypothetical protein
VHLAGPVARLLHRPEGSVPGDFAAMVETIHPADRESVMAQFWAAVSTAAVLPTQIPPEFRWPTLGHGGGRDRARCSWPAGTRARHQPGHNRAQGGRGTTAQERERDA